LNANLSTTNSRNKTFYMQICISTKQFEPWSLPYWTFTRFVLEVFDIAQRLKFKSQNWVTLSVGRYLRRMKSTETTSRVCLLQRNESNLGRWIEVVACPCGKMLHSVDLRTNLETMPIKSPVGARCLCTKLKTRSELGQTCVLPFWTQQFFQVAQFISFYSFAWRNRAKLN
jgi:hypothetical protein